MPLILFTIKVAPITTAPVEPALTKASPSPSARALKPTAIEESLFSLRTHLGSSHMEISLSASRIFIPSRLMLFSAAHFLIFSPLPARRISTPNLS